MFYSGFTNEGTHELLHYGYDEAIDPKVNCNLTGVYLYPTILGKEIVKYMPQIGKESFNEKLTEVNNYSYIDFVIRDHTLENTTVQYRITENVQTSDVPTKSSILFGTRIYDQRGLCVRHITPSQTIISNAYYENDVEDRWGTIERAKITKVHDMIKGDIIESATRVKLPYRGPAFLYDRIESSTIIRDDDKGSRCLDICYEYMPLFDNNFVHYLSDDVSHVTTTKKEFIYTHGDAKSGFVIYLYKYYNKPGIYRLKRIYSYDGYDTVSLFLFSYKNTGEIITMTKFGVNEVDKIALTNLMDQMVHPTCIDKILHKGKSFETIQHVVSRKRGRIVKIDSIGKHPVAITETLDTELRIDFNFNIKYDKQGRLIKVSQVVMKHGIPETIMLNELNYVDNPLEKANNTNLLSSVTQSYLREKYVKGKKICTAANTTVDFIYISNPTYKDVTNDIQKIKETLTQEDSEG